jgi:hypothetical protein
LVGRLKVPHQELFLLSRLERESLIDGHEIDIRERMEFERDMFGITVSPYAKKGWDVRKYYRLPWETEPVIERMTKTEIHDFNKIAEIVRAKRKKNKNGKS